MKKMRKVHHHIKNRCDGGRSVSSNLLYIKEDKEKLIHEVFGHRDFYNIILFILRVSRAKHYENITPKIKKLYKFLD